jgi:hypothetical protein
LKGLSTDQIIITIIITPVTIIIILGIATTTIISETETKIRNVTSVVKKGI